PRGLEQPPDALDRPPRDVRRLRGGEGSPLTRTLCSARSSALRCGPMSDPTSLEHRGARARSPEELRAAWAPLEALEPTLGTAAASRMTYRPPEVRVAPGADAESTVAFLARRAAALEESGRGSSPHEFEVLDRIGQGGMGVVFRARQTSLGRE